MQDDNTQYPMSNKEPQTSNDSAIANIEEKVLNEARKLKHGAQHGAENLLDGIKQDWGHVRAGASLIYEKVLCRDHDKNFAESEEEETHTASKPTTGKIRDIAVEAQQEMKSIRTYMDDNK